MTKTVAILGASGYTGAELIRILATHPAIRIGGPGRDRRLPRTLSEEEVSRLLDAAGRGIKSALRQIEDIRQAGMPTTYTREGTRRRLGPQASNLHHRL